MDTAALVLIIIVSAALTVFLIVLTILIILAIKLTKQVKLVADRAEKAVDTVASAGYILRDASGPLAIVKVVRNLVKEHKRKNNKTNKKNG